MNFVDGVRLAVAFIGAPWIALQVAARCALRGVERQKSDKGWAAMSVAVVASFSMDLIFGSQSLIARTATVLVLVVAAIADVLLIALLVEHGRRHEA